MRRILMTATALMAIAGAAWAGPREDVAAAEARWASAMQRKDQATLEKVLGREYTLAGETPAGRKPTRRAVWIDNTLHHLTIDQAGWERMDVKVEGRRAWVRGVFHWKGVFYDEAFDDRIGLEDRWVRRDGRWQAVSRIVLDKPPR